jgi:molybdenum cofactor cytidylyltransferase
MGDIWSIILAAGESKRMGFPKMLLSFNGLTMIETVINNVSSSEIDNTIVVFGANKELLMEKVSNYPVISCYNDNYKEGMLSSVKCGFRNLPADIEVVLVFQGDQPFITSEVINIVIKAYNSSEKGIVIPVYKNRRGHPLMVGRKYRDEIEKLDSNLGLRSLAEKFSEDVLEIDTEQSGILVDFDTYEDYEKEINKTL